MVGNDDDGTRYFPGGKLDILTLEEWNDLLSDRFFCMNSLHVGCALVQDHNSASVRENQERPKLTTFYDTSLGRWGSVTVLLSRLRGGTLVANMLGVSKSAPKRVYRPSYARFHV